MPARIYGPVNHPTRCLQYFAVLSVRREVALATSRSGSPSTPRPQGVGPAILRALTVTQTRPAFSLAGPTVMMKQALLQQARQKRFYSAAGVSICGRVHRRPTHRNSFPA